VCVFITAGPSTKLFTWGGGGGGGVNGGGGGFGNLLRVGNWGTLVCVFITAGPSTLVVGVKI
jgi:hypothetical protein